MGSQLGVLRTMLTDSQVEENEGSEGYEDSFTDDDDFSEGCVDEIVRPGTFEYNLYCSSDSEIAIDAVGAEFADNRFTEQSSDVFRNLETVTLAKVHDAEGILDLDEKISLIYLLYENPVDARDEIKDLLLKPRQSHKPIHEWARDKEETGCQWKQSFLEALAIIQDYRVLRTKFGFEKKAINDYFLPFNKYIAINVNKTRKMLYLIFDNLTSAKVKEVFAKVRRELAKKGKTFRIPDDDEKFYFELYLLDLERLNFIESNDAQNLASIFKQMDMLNITSSLECLITKEKKNAENFEKEKKLFVGTAEQQKCKVYLVQDNTKETSLIDEQQSLHSIKSSASLTNYYSMSETAPGVALIISNQFFYRDILTENEDLLPETDEVLEEREGTEVDEKSLWDTFKHLGFDENSIILAPNRTHSQIKQDVQDAANKVSKDHSSLFVVILTHGEKDVVYGVNSCRVEIRTIQKIMSTTNVTCLEGKPKVLILQCCQGKICQTIDGDDDDYAMDGPGSSKQNCLPKSVDQFTFLATVPGYGAIRHKTKGTWFIQTFCQIIQQYSDSQDFEEMCTEIVKEVSSKMWKKNGKIRCMVPLKWSTLRKKLYFPQKWRNI